MRYYARGPHVAIANSRVADGVIPVFLHPEGTQPIGHAYYCGHDARGTPVWSLKVYGRWLASRWHLGGGEFRPAP